MAPYRRFASATHQTCLAHLLRRCRELLDDAQRGQAKTPRAVRRILQAALAARAARDADQLDAAQVQAEAERLGAAVDRLLAGQTIYPPNRRLLDHLGRERTPCSPSWPSPSTPPGPRSTLPLGTSAPHLRAEHDTGGPPSAGAPSPAHNHPPAPQPNPLTQYLQDWSTWLVGGSPRAGSRCG